MFDCHVHTKYSSDSEMKIEEVINKINTNTVEGITITEHIDLDYPGDNKLFKFNIKDYFREYEKYKSNNINLGVELGLKPGSLSNLKSITKYNNFDFVIGSIHLVDDTDIYLKEFYVGKSKLEAYNKYLDSMIHCITNYKDYDSLGHIDYISRYSPYENRVLCYDTFKDKIDTILKILVADNKCLELNTRILSEENIAQNIIKIFSAYKEFGGKFVTVGSDAHTKDNIGGNFTKASEILQALSLKQVIFKNRKLIMAP